MLALAQDETRTGEWRSSGGDSAYTRYSPLAQINRDNVKNLRIVWRRPALDPQVPQQFPKLRTNNNLRATPTMIGGVLYAPGATGLLEAFDATTGETIWRQEPVPDMESETSASSTRGVDYWKGGSDHRLFTVRNGYLYALDLRGRALERVRRPPAGSSLVPEGARSFGWSSGPIVVGDVVVIAGNLDGAGDAGQKWKGSLPEDVRGFDARNGKLLWTFHVVPHAGEFGADTWGNDSGKFSGDLGSWCCVSADEELGLRLHTADRADRRVLRRIPAGGQPFLEQPRRAQRQDRETRLAFSDGPPRSVGVRPRSVRRPWARSRSRDGGSRR